MRLNQKTVLQSTCVRSFLINNACPSPLSTKQFATLINTVSIAIIPNWSGAIRRARMILMPNCIICLPPCSKSRQKTPLTALCFIVSATDYSIKHRYLPICVYVIVISFNRRRLHYPANHRLSVFYTFFKFQLRFPTKFYIYYRVYGPVANITIFF